MFEQVAKSCRRWFYRILHPKQMPMALGPLTGRDIVEACGFTLFRAEQRGFYCLISDSGERFVPCNSRDWLSKLVDHQRVHFIVQRLPGVASFYRFGQAVRLLAIRPLSSDY